MHEVIFSSTFNAEVGNYEEPSRNTGSTLDTTQCPTNSNIALNEERVT